MVEKALQMAGRYLLVSVVFGLLGLLLLYPYHPTTWLGSALWFVGILPLLAAAEGLGGLVFTNKVSRAINPRDDKLSAGRIAYGVLAVLLIVVIVSFGFSLAGAIGGEFWDKHFSDSW